MSDDCSRACSLVWLEHPADNGEATGSNPVMPTNFSFSVNYFIRLHSQDDLVLDTLEVLQDALLNILVLLRPI